MTSCSIGVFIGSIRAMPTGLVFEQMENHCFQTRDGAETRQASTCSNEGIQTNDWNGPDMLDPPLTGGRFLRKVVDGARLSFGPVCLGRALELATA